MVPVEILPFQENIILRARGSELLIQSVHVRKLQDLKKPRDFSQYFREEALVNRPARKLFQAWLRKDGTLWPRLYKAVQAIVMSERTPEVASAAESTGNVAKAPPVAPKSHAKDPLKTAPNSSAQEAPLETAKEKLTPTKSTESPKSKDPKAKPAKKLRADTSSLDETAAESLEKPQAKKSAKTVEKPKSPKKPSDAPVVAKPKKAETKPKASTKDTVKAKKKG